MIAGVVEGANHCFRKPDNMTEEECHSLHVRVEDVQCNVGVAQQFVSAWHPTPDELKRLNEGAPVLLTIISNVHPPVSLQVGEPTPL